MFVGVSKVVRDCLKKNLSLTSSVFENSVLSTVASSSRVGQWLNSFCHAILIGSEDQAPFQLFGLLLDDFREKWWLKGSQLEACRAEYQSSLKNNCNWSSFQRGGARLMENPKVLFFAGYFLCLSPSV